MTSPIAALLRECLRRGIRTHNNAWPSNVDARNPTELAVELIAKLPRDGDPWNLIAHDCCDTWDWNAGGDDGETTIIDCAIALSERLPCP